MRSTSASTFFHFLLTGSVALMVLPLATGIPLAFAPSAHAQNNVLLIVMDDIGTDLVSAYAESDLVDLTPNLDTLAQQGVLFRNAWAGPMCSATRAAIMTSRYAFRTGIGGAWGELQPEHPTLLNFSEALPP